MNQKLAILIKIDQQIAIFRFKANQQSNFDLENMSRRALKGNS
jgi:hypothetical protein